MVKFQLQSNISCFTFRFFLFVSGFFFSLFSVFASEPGYSKSEGLATILPLFKIHERPSEGGLVYKWWTQEQNAQNGFLRGETLNLIKNLEPLFRSKGFFMIDPVSQHLIQWLPEIFRTENISQEDLVFFGRFFKAHGRDRTAISRGY